MSSSHAPHNGSPEANDNRGPVGNVGTPGESFFASLKHEPDPEIGDFPTNPTEAPLPLGAAIYPPDSVLEDWMQFAQRYAESADCYLIGSILPILGAFMGRRVWYQLDRIKYPNIFALVTGKPGDRKSTAIKLAGEVATRLLDKKQFSPAVASVESLFDQYDEERGGCSDKLLLSDDANSILSNWAESSYGKIVAKKYLELYDCCELREAFRGNQKEGEGALRVIPITSTSVLFGVTFNLCRFNRLETKDGLSRRFLYYVANCMTRELFDPPQRTDADVTRLALLFEPLRHLKGQMTFAESTKSAWIDFQRENRRMMNAIPMGSGNDAYLSSLSESPSLVIKLAMLFQLCRYAKESTDNWQQIDNSSLNYAIKHVMHSMRCIKELDSIAQRASIIQDADTIHARVIAHFGGLAKSDTVLMSRSQLTDAYAKNPGRGGLTTTRLHAVLIRSLIDRSLAKCVRVDGKHRIAFRVTD